LKRIEELVYEIEKAQHPSEIASFSKLKVGSNFYRIKIGDFRVGLVLKGDLATFSGFFIAKIFIGFSPN
jgi:mRNA-degrading endonuclease RelE of RelBE toxin-antitoxin system